MARELAVMADYEEEGWPSMDLCAEMLLGHLPALGTIRPVRACPSFRRRAPRLPGHRGRRARFNADRLINRLWDYPRAARRLGRGPGLFHVCDHSYGHLVHALPPGRAGVYCHDLDAFRCLLDPAAEPRPAWFRAMMRHVLGGLGRAAVVFCSTEAYRRRIEAAGVADPARIVLAPYGVAAEFRPEPDERDESLPLPFGRDTPYVLHVGSMIPRKRIDVLLDAFAILRERVPGIKLVQVGGPWTGEQAEQIGRLGIAGDVVQLRGLGRDTLAGLYRRAAVVLIPSDAEGFGLPLIEALACGAVVVASDLEVFREVGGPAALYAPVGEPDAWGAIVADWLGGRVEPAPREARLARASRYTWESHARTIADAYLKLPG